MKITTDQFIDELKLGWGLQIEKDNMEDPWYLMLLNTATAYNLLDEDFIISEDHVQ